MGKRRDHDKLPIFQQADALVLEVFKKTESMEPSSGGDVGRYGPRGGLRESIRHEVLGITLTIIEGCGRDHRRGDLDDMLGEAEHHAVTARYLVSVAGRIGVYPEAQATLERFDALLRDLAEEQKRAND